MSGKIGIFFVFLACVGHFKLNANLDGTVTPTIINHCYQFIDGEIATGCVYFKRGFTVPAGAAATLRVTYPIDGPINLNASGTIKIAPATPLRLGSLSEGFTNGGILQSTDPFASIRLYLDNDIPIAGQLIFINQAQWFLQNHTVTLASSGVNNGSFYINVVPSGIIQFSNGIIVNVQDFATDSGFRFDSNGAEGNTYTFDGNVTLIATGTDATLTYQSAVAFQNGAQYLRTTGNCIVNNNNSFSLFGPSILSFAPSITCNSLGTFFLNSNTTLVLDSAKINMIVGISALTGSVVRIQGNAIITGVPDDKGNNPTWLFADPFNGNIDIQPGARLTLNGVDLRF